MGTTTLEKKMFLILFSLIQFTLAYSLSGKIVNVDHPSNAIITLTGNTNVFKQNVLNNGDFHFENIPTGSYLLKILKIDYTFADIRIDVSTKKEGVIIARFVENPDMRLSLPLKILPKFPNVYFEKPPAFNILSIFAHPMILMMVLMGGMSFCLPKLMENVDQDTLKEVQGVDPNAPKEQIEEVKLGAVSSNAIANAFNSKSLKNK